MDNEEKDYIDSQEFYDYVVWVLMDNFGYSRLELEKMKYSTNPSMVSLYNEMYYKSREEAKTLIDGYKYINKVKNIVRNVPVLG